MRYKLILRKYFLLLFLQEVEYISTYNIRDIKTDGHYSKDFQFVFIELPKFTKAEQETIIKLAYDELYKFYWNETDLVAYEERIMDVYKEENILAQNLMMLLKKVERKAERKAERKVQEK